MLVNLTAVRCCFHRRYLGPVEAVTWTILSYIWTTCSEIMEGIGEATEVRATFLCLARTDDLERTSAPLQVTVTKGMYLTITIAIFLASVLLILGDDFPTWITTSPAIQQTMVNLIPLFSIGFFSSSLGTTFRSLVHGIGGTSRCNNRDTVEGPAGANAVVAPFSNSNHVLRQSHIWHFVATWLVGIPLATVSTIVLEIDLRGQLAAITTGFALSGAVHAYLLHGVLMVDQAICLRE